MYRKGEAKDESLDIYKHKYLGFHLIMSKKKTTEEFIKECKDKNIIYDLSKITYNSAKEKVCAICPEHGEFWITPDNLLHGKGCPKCAIEKNRLRCTKGIEKFREEIENKYPNKFDLTQSEYIGTKTKIKVICHEKDEFGHEHGEFWITPSHLLNGQGCPKCNSFLYKKYIPYLYKQEVELIEYIPPHDNKDSKLRLRCIKHDKIFEIDTKQILKQEHLCPECRNEYNLKKQKENFIAKSCEKHNYFYRYDNVNFKDYSTKVSITCPIHGEFWQAPCNHIKGQGCPKCANEKRTSNTKEFTNKLKKLIGDKYDLTKVEYINAATKVCIICPEHGEFYATPNALLQGKGCPKCAGKYKTTEDIVNEFKKINGDRLDYSKVNYEKADKKVCIICPEHGEFWVTPNKHLQGRGCPKCKESYLERTVTNYLDSHNIKYIPQYPNKDIIGLKKCDFYIEEYNIVIECQGKQHIGYICGWNTEEKYKELLSRDIDKYRELSSAGIKVYYFFDERVFNSNIYTDKSFQGIYNKGNTYTQLDELFNKIKIDYNGQKEEKKE